MNIWWFILLVVIVVICWAIKRYRDNEMYHTMRFIFEHYITGNNSNFIISKSHYDKHKSAIDNIHLIDKDLFFDTLQKEYYIFVPECEFDNTIKKFREKYIKHLDKELTICLNEENERDVLDNIKKSWDEEKERFRKNIGV